MSKADHRPGSPLETAASAQAALMLLESLMMTMLDRKMIPANDLIEAIELTIATKRAAKDDEPDELASASIGILSRIATSLAAFRPAR